MLTTEKPMWRTVTEELLSSAIDSKNVSAASGFARALAGDVHAQQKLHDVLSLLIFNQ